MTITFYSMDNTLLYILYIYFTHTVLIHAISFLLGGESFTIFARHV